MKVTITVTIPEEDASAAFCIIEDALENANILWEMERESPTWRPASPPVPHTHRMGRPPKSDPYVRYCLGRGCNYMERRS